jgi:hypothetical protein
MQKRLALVITCALAGTSFAGPRLSQYATRLIDGTNAVRAKCPLGGPAPDDYGHECWMKGDQLEELWKAVDEKSDPQVAASKAYLDKLHVQVEKWKADDAAAESKHNRDYHRDDDIRHAEHDAEDLLRRLREGRDGKVSSTLISFDNLDADYVQHRLEMLRHAMPSVEDIAKGCAAGGGTKELCDLAANREKYFTKMMALQFDAIVAERLKAWTNAIDEMKNEGLAAVVNYNLLTSPTELGKDLGKEFGDIGKVLGQTNTKAAIDAKLGKLHADYAAALRSRIHDNPWAEHAKDATYPVDAASAKAVRSIPGLSVVRVAATQPTWEVIRGDFDKPVQRNRYVSAVMRKPGESFCRLYTLTVIEDHLGGGRYGEPHATAGSPPEFWVSACKS